MLINLTPHAITIVVSAEGAVMQQIPSSGVVRLKATTVTAGMIDNVKLSKTVYGEPQGLPEMVEGTYYIVSQLVKMLYQIELIC